MHKLSIVMVSSAVLLSGCSSFSSNFQVGNDLSYASLKDQREAMKSVKVYDAMPEGSESIGEVSASRCHRSFAEDAPTETTVLSDLKIAAYAKGADGISAVRITKASGLSRNCWYVLTGAAQAFSEPSK